MKIVKSKWKRQIKAISVLLIIYGMLFINTYAIFYVQNSLQSRSDANEKKTKEPIDNFVNSTPKSSEYQEFAGTGEPLNVTLHQSLVNSSNIEFPNLDLSNTFTEPFPKSSGYNTSLINMTLNNINAPNKSLIVEQGDTGSTLLVLNYWTSFTIVGDCYLENISVKVHTGGTGDTFSIDVWNATQSGSYPKYNTDLNGGAVLKSIFVNNPNPHWENVTNLHTRLYADQTYQKTFFVGMKAAGLDGYWHQENEANGDNSTVWRTGGSVPETGIDMTLKLGLAPLSNSPKPSDINLQINGTKVDDDLSGSNLGYWTPSQIFSSSMGELGFGITTDWWDVSCNVSNVQINFTKTDLKASSSFNIPSSGQEVQWNVSVAGGLNYFDARINDFNTINFTIPETWIDTTIQVLNDTIEKTGLIKRLLNL